MHCKQYIIKLIATMVAIMWCSFAEGQTFVRPCPEVLINEKYDHIGNPVYNGFGWDTAVSCDVHTIELTSEPYIPVQYFNGTYLVEEIEYNPPDPTFSRGTAMPISTDDDFAATATVIPYPFYFFGIRKNSFVLGANGMVTFNTAAAGHGCPWRYSAPIPWSNTTTGAPTSHDAPVAYMRDAIYGVYEDTHPLGSYLSGTQGIYYGIQDKYPCRKIICSWNGVPAYPGNENLNNRSTYQIVCYEGSNIIEVHVKHRAVNTDWQNGVGLIGIQNATGAGQVKNDTMGAPNSYVVPNSPAAFYPAGKNTFNTSLQYTAYRFTPQGTTPKTYEWYRIFDDGRDSVPLTTNQMDTNGYYLPMNSNDPDHPTLTKAVVNPTVVSRYVLRLSFRNANNDWYHLFDTITIGVDQGNELGIITSDEPLDSRRKDICQGQRATLSISHPESQDTRNINWEVARILRGQMINMPSSMYSIDESGRNITINDDPRYDTLPLNKIDSIFVRASVDFTNGCPNYDTFLVRIFPNFDTVRIEGICAGEKFTWNDNGMTYTESTTSAVARLKSAPGCDSVVHLHLTVYDRSMYVDKIVDCKPVRWHGKLYTTTNTLTAEGDTVVFVNRWGCDSVVRLDLSIYPMTPVIEKNIESFDYDHVDVELTDASKGNDSRRWVFPVGAEQTAKIAYWSIPATMDEAEIKLVTYSPYGCVDSTKVRIPFHKERMWVPNAFTPDDPSGNNLFGSVSTGTIRQEMYIYNRYGELVYRCEGIDCSWDGRDMDGNRCRQGAYIYMINYTTESEPERSIVKKGAVTLIR